MINTFAKIREVGWIVNQLPAIKENSPEHQKLMQRAGEIISEFVVPDNKVYSLDIHSFFKAL